MTRLLALLLSLLPGPLYCGTFDLHSSVDKTRVELGEVLVFRITVGMQGRMDFPPAVSVTPLEGFQAQGQPRQGQTINYVNGAGTVQNTWEWELVPIKAGTLTLGPVRAVAKNAAAGEIVKVAPAIKITVIRPKAFNYPTPVPDQEPPAQPGDDELRDIKGDLGLPWAHLGLLFLGFGSVLGGLAWMAASRPKVRKAVPVVRDPGQLALQELERARELLVVGDEAGYVKELARLYRFYMRHRLGQPEAQWTLGDCGRRAASVLAKQADDLVALDAGIGRLEALLYGADRFQAIDGDALYAGLRRGIVALERDAHWDPLASLGAHLDNVAERYGNSLSPEAASSALNDLRRLAKDQLEVLLARAEDAVDPGVSSGTRRLRLARDKVHADLMAALSRRSPAARKRLDLVFLSKSPLEQLDLGKLVKEMKLMMAVLHTGKEAQADTDETEAKNG